MIFSLGFLGLMLTFSFCRKPDVNFFSFITFFNRKEKLTDIGAKLYVVFCIMIIAGLMIGRISRGPEHADTGGIADQSSSVIDTTENSSLDYKKLGARDASYAALAQLKARYAGTPSEGVITDCSGMIRDAEGEQNSDVSGLVWRNARDYCVGFAQN